MRTRHTRLLPERTAPALVAAGFVIGLVCSTPAWGQPPVASASKATTTAKAPWLAWDASGQTGWVSASLPSGGWDYQVVWLGGSLGRYWTEHLKTEVDLAYAGVVNGWDWESRMSWGPPADTRKTQLKTAIGIIYQFGSNAMVHPFVGAGIDANFDRTVTERAAYTPGIPCPPQYCDPTPQPAYRSEARNVEAAGYVTAGFKFYVSRSAFIRLDERLSFTSSLNQFVTRVGVGFDF